MINPGPFVVSAALPPSEDRLISPAGASGRGRVVPFVGAELISPAGMSGRGRVVSFVGAELISPAGASGGVRIAMSVYFQKQIPQYGQGKARSNLPFMANRHKP